MSNRPVVTRGEWPVIQPLFYEAEAAKLLGIDARALRTEREAGNVTFRKVAGRIMYRADWLIEWQEGIRYEISGVKKKQAARPTDAIYARDLGLWPPLALAPVARCLTIAKTLRHPAKNTGYVYFVAGDDGRVKIGYSKDPKARLRSFQTGTWRPLQIIGLLRAAPEEERRLHKRFAEYRIHLEWFRLEGDLRSFIEGIGV